MGVNQFIQQKLANRRQLGTYRELRPETSLIDFCSNDYLGFAQSATLRQLVTQELGRHGSYFNGAGGSRLLAGNSTYAEDLERYIAACHNNEAALLFNSGYDANVGLLSCLPQRGDTVIHDEFAHASIIDGIRLTHANRYSFKHNDLNSLEQKLKQAKGIYYVVVESVYSMDGDLAPLTAMVEMAQHYNAALIVDEAHALGVFGRGLVNELQLQNQVFARVVTFGKALGCHGAAVLGSTALRQYLINFARSFIYTTAAPFHQLATVKMAYKLLEQGSSLTAQLQSKIKVYNDVMGIAPALPYSSAIKTVITGGNQYTKQIAGDLHQAGFDVRPVLSPTVAPGTERLRICLHTFNTDNDIKKLCNIIKLLQHEQ